MMKDDDFKLFRGFEDGQTDERTDIGDCRVAFATDMSSQHFFFFECIPNTKSINTQEELSSSNLYANNARKLMNYLE